MTIIELCDGDRRFLSYLLTKGSVARSEPLNPRHLIANGYVVESVIGNSHFEYFASDECKAYFKDRMNELSVTQSYSGPVGGCESGCV